MSTNQTSELGNEIESRKVNERRIESLDDIPREIADRRLHAEFGAWIAPEKSEIVQKTPDVLEEPEQFAESAKAAGMDDPTGVLGWSTKLEEPAHVLKGDVGKEIATLVHEDLHRVTHPETLREMTADPALRELYEGITEYLTEHAAEGLHDHKAGECYPEQVAEAKELAAEVGEPALREYFFEHEMHDELAKAIERIANRPH